MKPFVFCNETKLLTIHFIFMPDWNHSTLVINRVAEFNHVFNIIYEIIIKIKTFKLAFYKVLLHVWTFFEICMETSKE